MTDASLFTPLTFAHGPAMKNRLMLAPLTNTQSHPDGRLSDEEFRWLTMRAEGGFGLTMTCAAHVQAHVLEGQCAVGEQLRDVPHGHLVARGGCGSRVGLGRLQVSQIRCPG